MTLPNCKSKEALGSSCVISTRRGSHLLKTQKKSNAIRHTYQQSSTSFNSEAHFPAEEIQKQLQAAIARIEIQSQRQKVLQQLIEILKSEIFSSRSAYKQTDEVQEMSIERACKKSQECVDQILSRHNKQIAKIKDLKEQINGMRKQRAVFSNLFRKLEQEIKRYEKCYEHELMENQIRMKGQGEAKSGGEESTVIRAVSCLKIDRKSIRNKSLQSLLQADLKTSANLDNRFILSDHSQQQNRAMVKQQANGNIKEQPSSYEQISKKTIQISQYLNKLKMQTEISNTKQIISHYSKVREENEKIVGHISDCDDEIQKVATMAHRVRKQLRDFQLMRKYRYLTEKDVSLPDRLGTEEDTTCFGETECYQQILSVFQTDLLQEISAEFTQNQAKVIDQKIAQLVAAVPIQCGYRKQTQAGCFPVDCILEKMEKFENSERIMDKKMLLQQYYKQAHERVQGKMHGKAGGRMKISKKYQKEMKMSKSSARD